MALETAAATDDAVLGAIGRGEFSIVDRHPSPYRSSFPIEELDVRRDDGSQVTLAFKRLDWSDLDDRARVAKPGFLHEPEREARVYEELLPVGPEGPPRFHAALLEEGRHWLFVEWVDGRELYKVGELELWQEVARWLARFHHRFAADHAQLEDRCRLLHRDASSYRRWMSRAREFSRLPGGPSRRTVDWLAERQEIVIEALRALPQTVIHGEFYASNVLIDDRPAAPRIAPIDWELAGTGPGVLDLAALVSGWPAPDRQALFSAYATAAESCRPAPDSLEFARLQTAIQWLGWAPPEWRPPPSQRRDWESEAVEIAEGLGL
jgi:thiamine kinase-like enzyme